jgi:hypothetical protein
MLSLKKLTWDQLRREIDAGHPGIHRIIGTPDIDVFVDDGACRIGIRVPVKKDYRLKDTSPLAEVQIAVISVLDETFIQVSTASKQLYPEFVSFINSSVQRISSQPTDPESAIIETLKAWRTLLAPLAVMSEEQQVGLWGELYILKLMLNSVISANCWVGPQGEPHDFRAGTIELEIKTTRSLKRIHVISNLNQLTPTMGHKLFLISLQVAPAGTRGGENLSQMVNSICQQVALIEGAKEADDIREKIKNLGYREQHSGFYLGPFVLRNAPRVIFVDKTFPRITREYIEKIVGREASRIEDIQYRVDVEGLGSEIQPNILVLTVLGDMNGGIDFGTAKLNNSG